MAWNFERVAGPFKGRTGGLAWDGKGMLVSAVLEERVLRFDPQSGEAEDFRRWTGRVNGIAVAKDGSVFGAQEGGRRVIHFLNDGTAAPITDSETSDSISPTRVRAVSYAADRRPCRDQTIRTSGITSVMIPSVSCQLK